MKILMFVLLILGLFLAAFGTNAYISAINSGDAGETIAGMLFSGAIMVLGGIVLLLDLVMFIIYKLNAKKVQTA